MTNKVVEGAFRERSPEVSNTIEPYVMCETDIVNDIKVRQTLV